MTTKLTLSNSFMNNQELKDLRDKTIENTTDETTWGGTVKLEEIEDYEYSKARAGEEVMVDFVEKEDILG